MNSDAQEVKNDTTSQTTEEVGNVKLENLVEAILFWKGEPLSVKELIKITKSDEESIKSALKNLKENLNNRGIVLMEKTEPQNTEYSLSTYPEASALIEAITKEELSKDLGKASLETLSIILYKGPVKRSEIDYVRGVNSNFILRNLLIRGLIEKKQSPDDARASVYQASFELLSFLGIKDVSQLPNFELVQEELRQFKAGAEKEAEKNSDESTATDSEKEANFEPDEISNNEADNSTDDPPKNEDKGEKGESIG